MAMFNSLVTKLDSPLKAICQEMFTNVTVSVN
jgi:hypothetical protein